MTIVRSGTTDKYSRNWSKAFGSAGPGNKKAIAKPSVIAKSAKRGQAVSALSLGPGRFGAH